jgi:DNA-binding transcriptional LysR family regulator
MEAQIGLTLAVRTTRGSELTPAGLIVAEWASRLLEVANDVDAGLGSLRKEGRERIRVAASQTIAEQVMPHWLLSLQAEATRRGGIVPQVVLTATNSEHAIASVRDGTVDLSFIENPVPPQDLGSAVVGAREPHSGIRDSLTVALRRVLGGDMEQAPPVLELTSAAAMRAAVLAGAGPAAMSRLVVADDLAVGRLRAITVPELDLRRKFRAIWVGGRTPPAGAIRDVLSHIMNQAGHSEQV